MPAMLALALGLALRLAPGRAWSDESALVQRSLDEEVAFPRLGSKKREQELLPKDLESYRFRIGDQVEIDGIDPKQPIYITGYSKSPDRYKLSVKGKGDFLNVDGKVLRQSTKPGSPPSSVALAMSLQRKEEAEVQKLQSEQKQLHSEQRRLQSERERLLGERRKLQQFRQEQQERLQPKRRLPLMRPSRRPSRRPRFSWNKAYANSPYSQTGPGMGPGSPVASPYLSDNPEPTPASAMFQRLAEWNATLKRQEEERNKFLTEVTAKEQVALMKKEKLEKMFAQQEEEDALKVEQAEWQLEKERDKTEMMLDMEARKLQDQRDRFEKHDWEAREVDQMQKDVQAKIMDEEAVFRKQKAAAEKLQEEEISVLRSQLEEKKNVLNEQRSLHEQVADMRTNLEKTLSVASPIPKMEPKPVPKKIPEASPASPIPKFSPQEYFKRLASVQNKFWTEVPRDWKDVARESREFHQALLPHVPKRAGAGAPSTLPAKPIVKATPTLQGASKKAETDAP